jgi:hypothetical protein
MEFIVRNSNRAPSIFRIYSAYRRTLGEYLESGRLIFGKANDSGESVYKGGASLSRSPDSAGSKCIINCGDKIGIKNKLGLSGNYI